MIVHEAVGVIGASSFVGGCLLPLLVKAGVKVIAYSRQPDLQSSEDVIWQSALSENHSLDSSSQQMGQESSSSRSEGMDFVTNPQHAIPYWVCLAPIWVLPDYFHMLESTGAKRVVVLSSTSRFTKDHSSDTSERLLAQRFMVAEERLQTWAEEKKIEWVILRPTLIYGFGKDKNVSEIIRLIRRFGFFPLLGESCGLRQPIHAKDVAMSCMSALFATDSANKAYNLSGGETLTYREMVARIFLALNRKPIFLTLPLGLMKLIFAAMSLLPRYRHWKLAMVERMNQDMVFDHQEAAQDFKFSPRSFQLEADDLGVENKL